MCYPSWTSLSFFFHRLVHSSFVCCCLGSSSTILELFVLKRSLRKRVESNWDQQIWQSNNLIVFSECFGSFVFTQNSFVVIKKKERRKSTFDPARADQVFHELCVCVFWILTNKQRPEIVLATFVLFVWSFVKTLLFLVRLERPKRRRRWRRRRDEKVISGRFLEEEKVQEITCLAVCIDYWPHDRFFLSLSPLNGNHSQFYGPRNAGNRDVWEGVGEWVAGWGWYSTIVSLPRVKLFLVKQLFFKNAHKFSKITKISKITNPKSFFYEFINPIIFQFLSLPLPFIVRPKSIFF